MKKMIVVGLLLISYPLFIISSDQDTALGITIFVGSCAAYAYSSFLGNYVESNYFDENTVKSQVSKHHGMNIAKPQSVVCAMSDQDCKVDSSVMGSDLMNSCITQDSGRTTESSKSSRAPSPIAANYDLDNDCPYVFVEQVSTFRSLEKQLPDENK